jgi:hypothetical protein
VNILARVHEYLPQHCAGAEVMLHELLKALVRRGHRVQVHLSRFCRTTIPYVWDGVEVYPRDTRDWQDEAYKADVLITHLDNTSTVISAALAFRKPLVQVLHNTHAPTRMWASCKNDLLVYNSNWMAQELGNDRNGIVVRPPVPVADYMAKPGGMVTLVNLNQAKGGIVFAQLAALHPNIGFLGVMGAYGEQLDPRLPNALIRQHSSDMAWVYRRTKVLLMPSSYESYGRVGVEAACSGIPTIAADTPGIREALGDAGTFMPLDASAHDWSDALYRLLHDTGLYLERSMAAASRAVANEMLSQAEVETFCHRVESL